jgi:hypothetical protein
MVARYDGEAIVRSSAAGRLIGDGRRHGQLVDRLRHSYKNLSSLCCRRDAPRTATEQPRPEVSLHSRDGLADLRWCRETVAGCAGNRANPVNGQQC